MQNLKELEEIIDYNQSDDIYKRRHLSTLWTKRLEFQPTEDLEQWQKSLNIRNLVIDKSDDIDFYLKFSKLAQDSGNNEFGQRILNNLKKELMGTQKNQTLTNQLAKVDLAIYQTFFNSGIYAKTLKGDPRGKSSEEVENAISSLTRLI